MNKRKMIKVVCASRFLRLENPPLEGPDVVQIQQGLTTAGFYAQEIDGIFDHDLDQALRNFQSSNFLAADGVVGPDTWNRLSMIVPYLASSDQVISPNTNTTTISIDLNRRRLYFNSPQLVKNYRVAIGKPSTPSPVGNWVIVQKALNPGGAFGVRWMRLSVPWGGYGIHGTNRPSSIGKAASHGCIRMYNKDVIEVYDLTPLGTPVTISGTYKAARMLYRGTRGKDVRQLQSQLRLLGYYPGRLDGVFDSATKLALTHFQRDQQLATDGVLGPYTRTALQKALDIKQGQQEP